MTTYTGDDGRDTLIGSPRADLLSGLDGDDSLLGGNGADTLDGGRGNDTLVAGLGNDVVTGDTGADQFVGTIDQLNGDTFTDFRTEDVIIVRGERLTAERVSAVVFLGKTVLRIDADGDGHTDAQVIVQPRQNGELTVTASEPGAAASTEIRFLPIDYPSLSISAVIDDKAEGNSGATEFDFVVTRSGDLSRTSSVFFDVVGIGVAPANGADFQGGVLPSGVVSFGPGVASQTITLLIASDRTIEADESFAVRLSQPTGGIVGAAGEAHATILNADAPQLLSVAFRLVSESAAFRNTIGVYDTETLEARILEANVDVRSNPALSAGSLLAEEELLPEQWAKLAFFLIPDGYTLNPLLQGDPGALDLVVRTSDAGGFALFDRASASFLDGKRAAAYFSEVSRNADSLDHVQVTDDGNEMIVHWEDQFRLGDQDFDDVVLQVTVIAPAGSDFDLV